MKQKLGLACALIHTPEILFLDEPTCGVDPVSRRDFWRILYELLKENITIFVSTAYLDEAEHCTRVGLMHKGKILLSDEPNRLKMVPGMPVFEIFSPDAREAKGILAGAKGVTSVNIYGERLHIMVEDKEAIDNILDELRAKGIGIEGHREIVPSLEDVFITIVERQ